MKPVDVSVGRADFERLVRARRTSLLIDPDREVPASLVKELCQLAQWAPNHKRTWPLRCGIATGAGRSMLGAVIAATLVGESETAVEHARTKYLRAPAVLILGAAPGDSAIRTAENRDSVAAGAQTILLGATAAGLASFWSSCRESANDDVAAAFAFEPGTKIVAIVYLGWPMGTVTTPERPAIRMNAIE